MAWIEATYKRTIEVNAPLDEAADFMADPSRLKSCMLSVEEHEVIDEKTYRWLLKEVGARNITFRGDYTVRYERDGDLVTWESLEGTGNMRTSGKATYKEIGEGRTEIVYEEVLASDLPIPKLAAKVFRPIVAREVGKGIGELIDAIEETLNTGAHLSSEDS